MGGECFFRRNFNRQRSRDLENLSERSGWIIGLIGASSVYKAADPRLEGSMINYSNRGVVLQVGYSFF